MSERRWGQRPQRRRRGPRVFRVAEVNRAVRDTLEERFSDFWVEGEISEVRRSPAGHLYFSLSDEQEAAQLKAVLFRSDAAQLRTELFEGARVRVRGHISFYAPRGSTQLVARVILPAGEGDLAARFARLKETLAADGLLDPARKRPLPLLPRTVGIVTSRTSAALQDMLCVSERRAPVHIVVVDCRTQGKGAPATIIHALKRLEQHVPTLDLILLGRGGGSAEELWAFNDEALCRAIAACRVPIVCGVGHETDITLAELVADVRASTPSNAAELAIVEHAALQAELNGRLRRLQQGLAARVDGERLRLSRLHRRLAAPGAQMRSARQRLVAARENMLEAQRKRLKDARNRLETLRKRLLALDPRLTLGRARTTHRELSTRLEHALLRILQEERVRLERADARLRNTADAITTPRRARLKQHMATLDALSPLRVLRRGYAIALHEGKALLSSETVEDGDSLEIRLHEGSLRVRAEKDT